MAWFDVNKMYPNARHIRYIEIPKFFTWNLNYQSWRLRAQYKESTSLPNQFDFSRPHTNVVGRMYTISPKEGERYYLRTLLLRARSFEDLVSVEGKWCSSYREFCCELCILAYDKELERCIYDTFKSSFEPMTAIFANISAFCEPSNPQYLWNSNADKFIFDIQKRYSGVEEDAQLLYDDLYALLYAKYEFVSFLKDINPRLALEDFGFDSLDDELPQLPSAELCDTTEEEKLRSTFSEAVQNILFDSVPK